MSLCAEFIANDRPIVAMLQGRAAVPGFVNYPEEKFGGFLAQTDYRDPFIQDEIATHGWAIWPPIRYSYNTHNLDLPTPGAVAADMAADQRAMRARRAQNRRHGACPNAAARDIEWNWLGTDDQGRDVVARLIYGFRISVLFGLDPRLDLVGHRRRGRRCAGLFRRPDRS